MAKEPKQRPLPLLYAVSPALPIDSLRDALKAAGMLAAVAWSGRDGIKVAPAFGSPRQRIDDFVRGYISGFSA